MFPRFRIEGRTRRRPWESACSKASTNCSTLFFIVEADNWNFL